MDITKTMSGLRDKVTDADVLKTIGSDLADIERNFINLQEAKKSVDTESKDRKLDIRENWKPKVAEQEEKILDLEKEVKDLKEDNSSEALKTENKELTSFKTEVLTRRRTTFVDRFAKVSEHEKFEKVKSEFKLPKIDGDEKDVDYSKLDFKDVSEEDMDKNVEALNHLDRIEYFGEPSKTVDSDGKTVSKTSSTLKEKIDKAKTVKELEKIQEDEAAN